MKFIEAIELHLSTKTRAWAIVSKDSGARLGIVKFYPQWRRFAFHPNPNTLYESTCLIDLGNFCDAKTNEWREERRRAHAEGS